MKSRQNYKGRCFVKNGKCYWIVKAYQRVCKNSNHTDFNGKKVISVITPHSRIDILKSELDKIIF